MAGDQSCPNPLPSVELTGAQAIAGGIAYERGPARLATGAQRNSGCRRTLVGPDKHIAQQFDWIDFVNMIFM